jgi:hypothetical protein
MGKRLDCILGQPVVRIPKEIQSFVSIHCLASFQTRILHVPVSDGISFQKAYVRTATIIKPLTDKIALNIIPSMIIMVSGDQCIGSRWPATSRCEVLVLYVGSIEVKMSV